MLEQELTRMIKECLPNYSSPTQLAQHMLSDDCGVTCLEDLKFVTLSMIKSNNDIPSLTPIQAAKLMGYLKKNTSESDAGSSMQTGPHITPQPSISQPSTSQQQQPSAGEFSFLVPWRSMPRDLMERLEATSASKTRACPDDEKALRLAIGKKLRSAYDSFKDTHPGMQKTPGIDIYDNVTKQVFDRLPYCFKDMVDGNKVGDGQASFKKSFRLSIDNKYRDKNKSKPQKAIRGKGIVGVLQEQYQPIVRNSIEQAGLREHLQNLFNLNPTQWDWTEIRKDMSNTFELQREDVVKAKEIVEVVLEAGDEDNPAVRALAQAKALWPFLFKQSCLQDHHIRLTGRDIRTNLESYKENKLNSVLNYLTAHSTKSTLNFSLKLEMETFPPSDSNKLMCILFMIANHFKEDIEVFFKTVERTTLETEVDPPKDLCIIALNKQRFEAETFLVCADQTVLLETDGFSNALASAFELAFIFDLEYPSTLLQTFEYCERSVFQMAIENTKVKDKKGQTVLVLRPAIRDLVNGILKFETELANLKKI